MAIDTDEIFATLNHLVEVLIDSEEGFRRAAEAAKNPDLRLIFQEHREQRAAFAKELRMAVARLGGRPEAEGTMRGELRRTWVNLKLAIRRDGDSALIAEAQHADELALANYRKALGKDLPAEVRNIVAEQFSQIEDAQARIREFELRRAAG